MFGPVPALGMEGLVRKVPSGKVGEWAEETLPLKCKKILQVAKRELTAAGIIAGMPPSYVKLCAHGRLLKDVNAAIQTSTNSHTTFYRYFDKGIGLNKYGLMEWTGPFRVYVRRRNVWNYYIRYPDVFKMYCKVLFRDTLIKEGHCLAFHEPADKETYGWTEYPLYKPHLTAPTATRRPLSPPPQKRFFAALAPRRPNYAPPRNVNLPQSYRIASPSPRRPSYSPPRNANLPQSYRITPSVASGEVIDLTLDDDDDIESGEEDGEYDPILDSDGVFDLTLDGDEGN